MNKLIVSSSPHIRTKNETPRTMLDVIIALLPTAAAGAYIFGIRALLVIASCVLASIASEFIFNIIVKKEQTIYDLSAVVTGLILALNLRADTPIWQCIIGSVFAIIVVKCLFGGILGIERACQKRPVNPEGIASSIEAELQNAIVTEISSKSIGEMVLARLKESDIISYVRFASVYREYKDIDSFMEEIKSLARRHRRKPLDNSEVDNND